MDHAAWLNQDTDEDAQKAYKFFMRPDPDQRDFVGPKEEEYDPLTKTVATFRRSRVGMVRNAKDEDKKDVKVYLGFDGKPSLPTFDSTRRRTSRAGISPNTTTSRAPGRVRATATPC